MYDLRPYHSDAVKAVYDHLRDKDTNQLHNLPLMVTVGVDRNDPTRNVVKKYAAKAAQQTPAAQTSSATASGTPPWRR